MSKPKYIEEIIARILDLKSSENGVDMRIKLRVLQNPPNR